MGTAGGLWTAPEDAQLDGAMQTRLRMEGEDDDSQCRSRLTFLADGNCASTALYIFMTSDVEIYAVIEEAVQEARWARNHPGSRRDRIMDAVAVHIAETFYCMEESFFVTQINAATLALLHALSKTDDEDDDKDDARLKDLHTALASGMTLCKEHLTDLEVAGALVVALRAAHSSAREPFMPPRMIR
ncbi:hypothetical protein WJX81_008687 [Elliptochloris bilobata]